MNIDSITRKEVAKRAGVSVTTVSNVLNNTKNTRAEVAERVLAAAKDLNYYPNLIAKGLKTKYSKQIGVLISELQNPYFTEVLQGIEMEAAVLGYSVSIFLINGDISRKYSDIMMRRFAGLINLSNIPYTDKLQNSLLRSGAKLVCFDEKNGSEVGFDASSCIREFMKIVRDLGHKKVSFAVGYSANVAMQDARVRTFLDAYKDFCFEDHPYKCIYGKFPEVSSEQNGRNAVFYSLEHNNEATAMFAINDMTALGIISELQRNGIRVPEDVSVIGCDGINLGEIINPRIATIKAPRIEIGREMMREIQRQISGKSAQKVILPCEIVVRESLAKAKTN